MTMDFLKLSREDRASHIASCLARNAATAEPECCSMTAAMSRMSVAHPEIHKWWKSESANLVRIRKEALGWR